MFQTKVVQKIRTHILFGINSLQKLCHLWDNMERTRQAIYVNIIWCIHIACWLTEVTDMHLEYVICIAFPWQHWLHEPASLLYLYVHCMSCFVDAWGCYVAHCLCELCILIVCLLIGRVLYLDRSLHMWHPIL